MYTINDKCIACSRCAIECPVGAINEGADIYIPEELHEVAAFLDNPVEEVNRYSIDQDLCEQCGTCAEVCPVDAIVPVK